MHNNRVINPTNLVPVLSLIESSQNMPASAGVGRIFTKSDRKLYYIDSSGMEFQLQASFKGWGYQTFAAGSIVTSLVTITNNENGTSIYPFDPAKIINSTAVIVRADDPESFAYNGVYRLFSTKVVVDSHTGDEVTINAFPHISWGDIRVYYYYDYFNGGIPDGYSVAPKNISKQLFSELDNLFVTEEEYTARIAGFVDLSTAQVISGVKTFQFARGTGNPTNPLDFATKSYVDSNASSGGGLSSVDIQVDGSIIGSRGTINFITGTGIQFDATDDVGNTRVNIIISGTGSGGGGGSPTGAAGGDLTGTYPNPTLRNSVISGNKLSANSILQGHVQNGFVDLISNQVISGTKIFHTLRTTGNPENLNDVTNRYYVDSVVSGVSGGISSIDILSGSFLVGSRPKINFIQGPNVSLNIADNVILNSVDIIVSGLASSSNNYAPVDAHYLVISGNSTLSNERRLVAGNNVTFIDNGPNSTFVISATVSGSGGGGSSNSYFPSGW